MANESAENGEQGQSTTIKLPAEERVVLKEFILPTNMTRSGQNGFASDFENELEIVKSIDHPNIVKLEGVFAENRRVYSVLEYIDRPSLLQLVCDKGALPEKQVIDLALQMCDLLAYLHSQAPPIIHCDFAPDNLILTPESKLKLIDFSIAQRLNKPTSISVAGKQAYIAPEQFAGNACLQSDIYSLGATLFYLLTGKAPEPISQSHPKTKKAELSPEIDAIVAKATAFKANERYQNTAELKVVLEDLSAKNE